MTVATHPLTGTYNVDPVHSSLTFAVKHMVVSNFRASFENFTGSFVVDERGARLSGSAPVDSVSIKEPPEFRDHVVNGADFFDAENHPELEANSTDLVLNEDGTVTVNGELTIRGITKPVTATGTYTPPTEDPFGNLRAALELTATVDRRDWGLNWQAELPAGGDALGYSIELSANIELVREA
jgi:polyisoprenoid-binding protein YceI